jgi:hypothetical protein
MKRISNILLVLALCVPSFVQAADKTLTATEAKDHIGQKATVCGIVASTHYAAGSHGSPTFINLDKAYPNQVFTIVIWGDDLSKFTDKPTSWEGKKLCATGTIDRYRNIPEIVAKLPSQITVTK